MLSVIRRVDTEFRNTKSAKFRKKNSYFAKFLYYFATLHRKYHKISRNERKLPEKV
jgi:hypothetical protein